METKSDLLSIGENEELEDEQIESKATSKVL